MNTYKKALQEIADIVLRYHKENGNSPEANHCRNIAIEALSNKPTTESDAVRKAWEAGWNERNKACGLSKAWVLKRKFEQWNIYKQTIDI